MQDEGLQRAAEAYGVELGLAKRTIDPAFPWYPYGSLSNFTHLRDILAAHPLSTLTAGGPVLDIGAADGEAAFFLESLGFKVTIIDHAATNYNGLRGANLLRTHLGSSVTIEDIDLDSQFRLPAETYSLIFFLGILYHLKNPFYVLEQLARSARHLLVSTRVAKFAPTGERMHKLPVAYLLSPDESNNDATNFWIFSEAGLKRLFSRTGWEVMSFITVGDTRHSDPARNDRDERAFALLRSTRRS